MIQLFSKRIQLKSRAKQLSIKKLGLFHKFFLILINKLFKKKKSLKALSVMRENTLLTLAFF